MKSIKKIIMAALCALLSVLLAACGPGAATTGTTGGNVTPTPTAESQTDIAMKPGDVYRIYYCNNLVENQQVDGVTSGIRAQEGRDRWLKIQQDYGITITWVASTFGNEWLTAVPAAAAASEPVCDIYHMGGPFAIPASLTYGDVEAGTYYENLDDYSKYTNFDDNSYWDQSAQKAVGYYNGKHYVAVPQEVGWNSVAVNQVCFFNKTLLSGGGHSADEIYQLYKNGEWTFEKFRQIAIDCADVDKGVYGLPITRSVMSVLSLICANGGSVLTNNANGIPEFSADSQKALTAIHFFLDLCVKDNIMLTENTIWQEEAPYFKAGNVVLMLTYANRVQVGEGPLSGAIYQEDGLEYGIVLPPKGPDAEDYLSDKNWYSPLAVFKGHDNPAGVVQCMSMYMSPSVAVGSVESELLLDADSSVYFQDRESVDVLKDVASKNVTTSYMAYWDLLKSGVGLCKLTTYGIEKWISGESTPELDYAAGKEAVNSVIASAIGG